MDIVKIAERIAKGFGRNQGHTRAAIEGAKVACGFEDTYPVVVFGSSEHERFSGKHLKTQDGSLYSLGMTSLSDLQFPKFIPEHEYKMPVIFDSHAVVLLARGLLKEIANRDEEIERLKGGDEYLKKKGLAKLSREERVALGLELDAKDLQVHVRQSGRDLANAFSRPSLRSTGELHDYALRMSARTGGSPGEVQVSMDDLMTLVAYYESRPTLAVGGEPQHGWYFDTPYGRILVKSV